MAGPALTQKQQILVVDDEADFAESLAALFEFEGYQVFTAGDGLQAPESLEAEPNIALVTLDVIMPNMDGITFLRRVRQNERFSGLPIIVLSANPPGIQGCVEAIFLKPIDFDVLLTEVRKLLSRARPTLDPFLAKRHPITAPGQTPEPPLRK